MRFRTNISDKNKKISTEFSKQEKQILFDFLDKYPDSEAAMDFILKWFNCTRTTIIVLMMENTKDL